MQEVKIFNNDEFGQVRTVTIDGEAWFVGKDVASVLGYGNPRDAVSKHVDDEDKGVAKCDTLGGSQDLSVVNESGLYALIFGSKMPNARKFKHWVTSEVLPSIRKTGNYKKPQNPLELLELHYEAIKEVNGKVDNVKQELEDFKMDMPILALEIEKISGAVKKMGVKCLGGKDSNAYKNKSLRSKVYKDIYGQLKRAFDVKTFKAIKRSQCDVAIELIRNYTLSYALSEQVNNCNAQLSFLPGGNYESQPC